MATAIDQLEQAVVATAQGMKWTVSHVNGDGHVTVTGLAATPFPSQQRVHLRPTDSDVMVTILGKTVEVYGKSGDVTKFLLHRCGVAAVDTAKFDEKIVNLQRVVTDFKTKFTGPAKVEPNGSRFECSGLVIEKGSNGIYHVSKPDGNIGGRWASHFPGNSWVGNLSGLCENASFGKYVLVILGYIKIVIDGDNDAVVYAPGGNVVGRCTAGRWQVEGQPPPNNTVAVGNLTVEVGDDAVRVLKGDALVQTVAFGEKQSRTVRVEDLDLTVCNDRTVYTQRDGVAARHAMGGWAVHNCFGDLLDAVLEDPTRPKDRPLPLAHGAIIIGDRIAFVYHGLGIVHVSVVDARKGWWGSSTVAHYGTTAGGWWCADGGEITVADERSITFGGNVIAVLDDKVVFSAKPPVTASAVYHFDAKVWTVTDEPIEQWSRVCDFGQLAKSYSLGNETWLQIIARLGQALLSGQAANRPTVRPLGTYFLLSGGESCPHCHEHRVTDDIHGQRSFLCGWSVGTTCHGDHYLKAAGLC